MSYESIMYVEVRGENSKNPTRSYVADLMLPTTKERINDALDRCRSYLVATNMDELEVETCEKVPELEHIDLNGPTLFELNFLAWQIDLFDESELATYRALFPLIVKDGKVDIKDAINLTYSVDDHMVAIGVVDDEDIGLMVLDNNLSDRFKDVPEDVMGLLDLSKIGAEFRDKDNGVFINNCYVSRVGFVLKDKYNGENLPAQMNDSFLFSMKVKSRDGLTRWYNFPLHEQDMKELAAEHKSLKVEKLRSSFPQVYAFSENDKAPSIDNQQILEINNLAKKYLELDWQNRLYFRAALSYECIQSFDDLEKMNLIIRNLDKYSVKEQNVFSADFGLDYLQKHLKSTFDMKYLDFVDTARLGGKLLEEYSGKYSPYGIVLRRDLTMDFEQVNYTEYELAEVCGRKVLITDDRVADKDVPKGMFKYELRQDELHIYSTLEEKVSVDFSGTIISKRPFKLNEEGYIDLLANPDDYPDLLSQPMTLEEFQESDYDEIEEIVEDGGMQQC